MKRFLSLLISIMMLTSFINVVVAENSITLNPGDSIQQAIDDIGTEGTITLNPGVYTGNGNYNIVIKNKKISIQSNGDATIDAESRGRIFSVAIDSTLNLANVKLDNGYLTGNGNNGASIENNGTCTVTNSILSNNYAEYGGAAINNNGTLTVTDSTMTNNTAQATYRAGAGIRNYGECYVYRSTFDNNIGTGKFCSGGAIMSAGGKKIEIKDSTFIENLAGYGGAIYISSKDNGTITNNTFTNNSAGKYGSGLANYGNCDVSDSKFTANSVSIGGALYNNGTIRLDSSNFTKNEATAEDGSSGGALLNDKVCTIAKTKFTANSAYTGGAITNKGDMNITETILNNNSVSFRGGAIYNDNGDLNINGGTLANNSILNDNSADNGGAVSNNMGNLTITDSSFENNNAKPGEGNYGQHGCGGAIDNLKGNLIVSNTKFDSNHGRYGGAINSYYGYLKLINCQIVNNEADSAGGGVCSNAGTQDIDNQTMSKFDSNKPGDMFHFTG
ncbi:MAG: hypothetical protein LBC39_08320 [Methanobrevibacter sp.]|jgi:hypothetical protein|nr:hypothetical protein [Candidatus Methanovirga aequatorialis]